MNNQAIVQLLGIAKRAGELTTGENLVIKKVRQQSVFFVFVAEDAGVATAKKITDKCRFYHIPVSQELTRAEISHAIGQPRTVVAINQKGFAQKFQTLTNNLEKGE